MALTAVGPAAHAVSKVAWSKVSLPASASGEVPLPVDATETPSESRPAVEIAWRMLVSTLSSVSSPKSAPCLASSSLCGLTTRFSVSLLRTRSTASL